MASELNYDKLVKLVKGDNEITQAAAAEHLGLTIGQVSMLAFCQAKVEVGIYTKAPATAASVKKLRAEGNRYELIAARTGLSVKAVKDLAEETGATGYVGRGRDFSAGGGASRKTASVRSGSKTKSVSSRSGSKTKTRSSGSKKTSSRSSGATANRKGASVVRRTTRRSVAGNPS